MPEAEACLVTASAAATRRLGRAIGASARAGDWLGLGGELGAGKTTLAQGIARGLAAGQAVVSPTFVLCNIYRGRLTIHHYDLYRLSQAEELWQIGYEEAASGTGLCLVEWYERIPECRPQNSLCVDIAIVSECKRRLNFLARGERAISWLEQIRKAYRA
jgi:tRNA threonylcarbamoyladenosine biosynthesis protein TsaE